MYDCMCTQGNPIYSECDTVHGIPDPVIFVTPNIPTKGNLKENEKMPKSTHDKIREGDQNTNPILKEIRSKIKGKIIIGHLNINSL